MVSLFFIYPVKIVFFILLLAALPGNAAATIPQEAYRGCEEYTLVPGNTEDPRARVSERKNKIDPITQRTFASFSLDEVVEGVPKDKDALCWFRLDGVWRETGDVTLDESESFDGWGSDTEELLSLTNGTYTTLDHLVIEKSAQPEKKLRLRDGLLGSSFVEFVSDDGLSLKEVLQRGGPAKLYRARQPFGFGQKLVVDVSRSGRIRMTFGNKAFIRPKPGVSKATIASQLPADDAFLLSYNLENLSASRRGYDVVSQDPFFLLQNPKYEIFAEVDPKNYFISEKRTIPMGFSLVQEVSQGTVFRESLVSSETDYQRTVSSSFGAKIGGSKQAMANNPFAPAVGASSSSSYIEGMKESNTVGQALGYSRSKQYTLVVDHPYISLSDDFLDAVEDARRYGKYQNIIDKFGSHYPYAVTYGAAAKMTMSFTKTSYTEMMQQDDSFAANGGGTVYGVGGMVDYSDSMSERTSQSGAIGDTGATFVAVGGNGSWNENGYNAGTTPYPILLDLRPIDELLNPMNFPGEPEIYQSVRVKLRSAIRDYLFQYNDVLSDSSLLPVVEPPRAEPVEKWLVYVRQTWCTGHKLVNPVKEVRGTLYGEVKTGNTYSSKREKALSIPCKKKDKAKTWKGSGQNLITLSGSRSQLAKKKLQYNYEWRYVPSLAKYKLSKQKKTFTLPLHKKLAVGKSHDEIWVVKGKPKLPYPKIRLRFKRVE